MPTPTTHAKIVHAEAEAARHLGNYNAACERGAIAAAEKHLARAQRWLDKANDLRGLGSA